MSTGPCLRTLWIYRQLLRIYPTSFRREYEAPLLLHLADCYNDTQPDGSLASLMRFWRAALLDLGQSAALERIDEMRQSRWWLWLLVLVLGLVIGIIDFTSTEVQSTLLVLLPVAFLCGLAAPRLAWLSGLILGLSIPVIHVIGHMLHMLPPYPSFVWDTFLALIPAILAAYLGAGVRWVIRQSTHLAPQSSRTWMRRKLHR